MKSNTNQPVLPTPKYVSTLVMIAKISSSLLFFGWGVIFFEKLPLFISYQGKTPSLVNWVLQGIFLVLLIGYLLVFKKPKIACFVITISALIFFPFVADQNTVPYTLISLIPVYILAFLWVREKQFKRI
jgi:hypothetical protein